MKVWRKNRTQYAKEFFLDGKMILAFLVGEQFGVQNIETLKGELKKISVSKIINESEKKQSEEFEVEYEKSGNTTVETKTYKDGRKESTPMVRM